MKLPIIKNITEFIEKNDEDFVHESVELLEHISQSKGLSDHELDVIGELLSNMYGALEVNKKVKKGEDKKKALNDFMSRVLSTINK